MSWIFTKERERRELVIEFNKLGSMSLFASPGTYSFILQGITALLHQRDELSSLPHSSTGLFFGGWGVYRGRCFTIEACQSDLSF